MIQAWAEERDRRVGQARHLCKTLSGRKRDAALVAMSQKATDEIVELLEALARLVLVSSEGYVEARRELARIGPSCQAVAEIVGRAQVAHVQETLTLSPAELDKVLRNIHQSAVIGQAVIEDLNSAEISGVPVASAMTMSVRASDAYGIGCALHAASVEEVDAAVGALALAFESAVNGCERDVGGWATLPPGHDGALLASVSPMSVALSLPLVVVDVETNVETGVVRMRPSQTELLLALRDHAASPWKLSNPEIPEGWAARPGGERE